MSPAKKLLNNCIYKYEIEIINTHLLYYEEIGYLLTFNNVFCAANLLFIFREFKLSYVKTTILLAAV